MRTQVFAGAAIAGMVLGSATLAAQERQGRFVMSPSENGFVRLDTETGAMSLCSRRDSRWTCEPMEDEARALREENARLKAENERLKAQAQQPIPGPERRAERPGRKLELPSEEDVDKAFDYVERLFRKFRDRLKEFEQEERKGTPL
jgi:hypothetical protein